MFIPLWSQQSKNGSNWWRFWSKLYLGCLFLFSARDSWGSWLNWFGHLPHRMNRLNITSTIQDAQAVALRSQFLSKSYTCVQKRETIHECLGWGEKRKPLPFFMCIETPADVIRGLCPYNQSCICSFICPGSPWLQQEPHCDLSPSVLAPVQTTFCSTGRDLSTVLQCWHDISAGFLAWRPRSWSSLCLHKPTPFLYPHVCPSLLSSNIRPLGTPLSI